MSQPSKINYQLQEASCSCPDCGAPSVAVRYVTSVHDYEKPFVAKLCRDCLALAEAEAARARHQSECAQRLEVLGVPPLYAAASLDTFVLHGADTERAKQQRALEFAREYIARWPNVPMIAVFSGGCGSGKGHLAWSIARQLAGTQAVLVRACVLSDVIRDLREAWHSREDGPSEAQRLARYRGADLLVIDEVSRHAFYGQPQQHLYDLVAWREVRLKATLLTTNEVGGQLAEVLGPALSSRAAGWGGFVDFGIEDYRVTYGLRRTA